MKNGLEKWRKEIIEVSNNVYKVTLTHELGSIIEQTGHELELIEKEVELSAMKMNKEIDEKIKTHNKWL